MTCLCPVWRYDWPGSSLSVLHPRIKVTSSVIISQKGPKLPSFVARLCPALRFHHTRGTVCLLWRPASPCVAEHQHWGYPTVSCLVLPRWKHEQETAPWSQIAYSKQLLGSLRSLRLKWDPSIWLNTQKKKKDDGKGKLTLISQVAHIFIENS